MWLYTCVTYIYDIWHYEWKIVDIYLYIDQKLM